MSGTRGQNQFLDSTKPVLKSASKRSSQVRGFYCGVKQHRVEEFKKQHNNMFLSQNIGAELQLVYNYGLAETVLSNHYFDDEQQSALAQIPLCSSTE